MAVGSLPIHVQEMALIEDLLYVAEVVAILCYGLTVKKLCVFLQYLTILLAHI